MAEKPAQERTERATPKRLQQAKEKGQVARSRELTTMVVLLVSAGGLFLIGGGVISGILDVMHDGFQAQRRDIMDPQAMLPKLEGAIAGVVTAMLPFFVVVATAALLAP